MDCHTCNMSRAFAPRILQRICEDMIQNEPGVGLYMQGDTL